MSAEALPKASRPSTHLRPLSSDLYLLAINEPQLAQRCPGPTLWACLWGALEAEAVALMLHPPSS